MYRDFIRSVRIIGNLRGFTMLEVVIATGIITLFSSIVLVNFTALGEGAAMNKAVNSVAQNLRHAQNMSLAVRRTDVSPEIPRAVGVHFSRGSGNDRIIIFADLNNNGQYAPSEKISETVFSRGIRIVQFRDITSPPSSLNVRFLAPEASLSITRNNNGEPILPSQKLTIVLCPPSGISGSTCTASKERKVEIWITGQISIK